MEILVETFDPPIIHVTGFFLFFKISSSALISFSKRGPAKLGKNLVIALREACFLCEHEKASLIKTSPSFDNLFANFSSSNSSSLENLMFSKKRISPEFSFFENSIVCSFISSSKK